MPKSFWTWYFPILLLPGSLILAGLSFTGCGPLALPTTSQCPTGKHCPDTHNHPATATPINAAQATTIIETPVSKTPLEAYIVLSSSDGLDSGRFVPQGAHLHIQLIPHGKLNNGRAGKALFFNRIATHDDMGLSNIPPGTYTIRVSGTDADGGHLSVCLSYNDDQPAPSQTVALQNGLLGVEGQSATQMQVMTCPE
jgi:hypothetical protein